MVQEIKMTYRIHDLAHRVMPFSVSTHPVPGDDKKHMSQLNFRGEPILFLPGWTAAAIAIRLNDLFLDGKCNVVDKEEKTDEFEYRPKKVDPPKAKKPARKRKK